MTIAPRSGRPTNGERRAAAREKARRLRYDQQRRDKRNRWLMLTGIVAGLLAIGAVIAVVLITSIRPPQPGPSNMLSDGVLLGKELQAVRTPGQAPGGTPVPNKPDTSGQVATIVEYVDYYSALAGQFQKANSDALATLVGTGAATLEIHPVALLTNQSGGSKYSLRAANAAACVASYAPDSFWKFHDQLLAQQQGMGNDGLSDTELLRTLRSTGASNAQTVGDCITQQRYQSWVEHATDRALQGPLPNSDTKRLGDSSLLVLVDGQTYKGALDSPEDFRTFILQAQGQAYDTSSSSPQPSPSSSTVVSSKPGKKG